MRQLKFSLGLLCAVTFILMAVPAVSQAVVNAWDGDTSTNWSDGGNWSAGVPVDGADVSISSGTTYAPTLASASADLASLVVDSGQTLTVSGWNSTVQATNMTIAGTITHLSNSSVTTTNALGEWVPLHRVLLAGSNITIAAGGKIDADYLGYPPGAGPGGGWNAYGPGPAHAGAGVRSFGGALPTTQPYGDPMAPEQPGSGGGTHGNSRPGGGAVKIIADGHLSIDGEIRANGQNGLNAHGSGGAGGSIWLACHTFAGTATGLISVDGGNAYYYGGEGSGGRIALHYDEDPQSNLPEPNPPVRFSGKPGAHLSALAGNDIAAMSTLYLPDTQFIDGTFTGQHFWYTSLVIPGFTSSWSRTSLTLDNCVIGLPEGMDLHVDGDLIVTNGGGLHVFAEPVTNVLTEAGARVTVGNDLRVAAGSWIHPYCASTNGATVKFVVSNDLFVASTGGIDADFKGYAFGYGPGLPVHYAGGAGYGGIGGEGAYAQFPGPSYGDPEGPIQAGSGAQVGLKSGQGGGAIDFDVTGKAEIHGLLTARGAMGMYSHGTAGAGGGIRIECTTFEGSNTGLLRVDGGWGNLGGGCGGGGRIAVVYNPGAQAGLPDPRPPVRFSAHVYDRTTGTDVNRPAQFGTVYFPDMTIFTAGPTTSAVLDQHRFWYVRPIFGDNGFDSWNPASLVISNCVIEFPYGYSLDVSGDLTVGSDGSVPSDLRLEGAVNSASGYPFNYLAGPKAGFYMQAVYTNSLYGARLDVGGDLAIGPDSWIFPGACGTNGAVVGIFVSGNVTTDAGGGINANETGFFAQSGNNNGPGAGQSTYLSGGGYGGGGGGFSSNTTTHVVTYYGGTNYGLAELPLAPGSPAGYNTWGGGNSLGGSGGGAVHLRTDGVLTQNGTFRADGQRGDYYRGGGGSGGSIFIVCKDISGSGVLSAQGAVGDQATATHNYGGGGRIAVWHGPVLDSMDSRIAETNIADLVYSDSYAGFSGVLSVTNGTGTNYLLVTTAEHGTKGFYYIPPPAGTMILIW